VCCVGQAGGVDARVKSYEGKTHTQPLIEDPMRGGRDVLMDDVLEMVTGEEQCHWQFPMCPGPLITLASAVCPF
jgi:prenylcysteine alpha-carboxyl methylesterase